MFTVRAEASKVMHPRRPVHQKANVDASSRRVQWSVSGVCAGVPSQGFTGVYKIRVCVICPCIFLVADLVEYANMHVGVRVSP